MGTAGKPICQFCKNSERVIQIRVLGVFTYLHPWCAYGYEKFMLAKVTPAKPGRSGPQAPPRSSAAAP